MQPKHLRSQPGFSYLLLLALKAVVGCRPTVPRGTVSVRSTTDEQLHHLRSCAAHSLDEWSGSTDALNLQFCTGVQQPASHVRLTSDTGKM